MNNIQLNEETINSLKINNAQLIQQISLEKKINQQNINNTINLLLDDNTVPFISRYRKEMTGSLDEVKVREISHRYNYLYNLEKRKIEVIKAVFSQGKLTETLFQNINKAETQTEVEDLYSPYKKKKKTKAMIAQEKGLEPLADFILENMQDAIEKHAVSFINKEKKVNSKEEAIQGAEDIIAERIAEDIENKRKIKNFILNTGVITVKGLKDKENSVYQMYYDYTESIKTIKPHCVLAIFRGDNEKELAFKFEFNFQDTLNILLNKYKPNNSFYTEAIEDSLKRLIIPSVKRDIKNTLKENADYYAIGVFEKNLKALFMQTPIKQTRVLGIDPGIRTGTKAAIVDETGKYLANFIFNQEKQEDSISKLTQHIKKHNIQLIALGNGTGSHEVQEVIAKTIEQQSLNISYTIVSEDGASVYSASEIAREEFPELDLTIRGAISIARRIQDPLSELVKIDSKSLGIGLYQHDVNQKHLSEKLNETVELIVNNVGVNLNTCSWALLQYVSGIKKAIAKRIINQRNTQGKFRSREALKQIQGLGENIFKQAAGFLKIPSSSEPLDNTWVHPENYKLGRIILKTIQSGGKISADLKAELKQKFNTGDETINDIILTLEKPNLDPRDDYPKPILQKNVINFENLKPEMILKGKVKNVVNFGAFIDIGIKESALLHISNMSEKFVKDPFDVVQVGDTVDVKIIDIDKIRKRISVSMVL